MKKKIVILTSIIFLFSVITVNVGNVANAATENNFAKVMLNGKEVDSKVPVYFIEGTTVLPVRAIAEAIGLISKWESDKQTVQLIKPNVNMLFTTAVKDNKGNTMVYSPFGKISQAMRYNFSFYVYSEVDNLPNEKLQIKVVLFDPDGKKVQEGDVESFDATNENSLQYINFFKDITFVKSGTYRVQFLLKSQSTNNEYLKIGEKLIFVK